VIKIDESVGWPDFVPEVIARHYAPGVFEQDDEYLKRLLL
jgi:hypothetical protein